MRKSRYVCAVVFAAAAGPLLVAGCGSPDSGSPAVPSLSQAASHGSQAAAAQGSQAAAAQGSQAAASQGNSDQAASAQGSWAGRAAELHAAAQCIRQHGIPAYSDPVLSSGGEVYSDSRPVQDASQSTLDAIQQACGALAARAGLNPLSEPPAPTQLVEAGVRSAECLRAHGLPNVHDPNAQSEYTPGHGFGLSADEVPPGGKASPAFQAATHACRPVLDAEIRASTLASLGDDG